MASVDAPDLGPFLIIQLAVGLAIVVPTLLALWRAVVRRNRDDAGTPAAPNLLFFDGPLKAALDLMQGSYRQIVETRKDNEKTVQEFRQRHETELEILRNIRDLLTRLIEDIRRTRRR